MRKVDIDMLTKRLEWTFRQNGCPTKYVSDIRKVLWNTPTAINNDDVVYCKDCANAFYDDTITTSFDERYQCGLMHEDKWVCGDFFCALGRKK